jgi:hypothetical protein
MFMIPMYLHMKIFSTLETMSFAWSTDNNAAYMALVVYWRFSPSHINMTNFLTKLIPNIVFAKKKNPLSWVYLREGLKIWMSNTLVRTSNHTRQVLWEWKIIYWKQEVRYLHTYRLSENANAFSEQNKGRVANSLGSYRFCKGMDVNSSLSQ